MKTNLLLVALMLITTVAFSQKKDESKSDEKPLRKIAGGTGAKQIEEDVEREVERAMKDLRVELDDLDIKINLDVLQSLEGLDELIEHNVEVNLEGLDVQIEQSIEQSLRVLDHLDINIDLDNIDVDLDNDRSIEEFRKEALKGVHDLDTPKKDPKKKD
ncbi:MAG: hypothetical protein WDO14_13995 [Bacteroidota bacterium]